MKKLITILFVLPLIFSSCEKEDESPNSNSNNGNNNTTVNTTTGYFSTQSGSIFKTTDSGVTWTFQGDGYTGTSGVGISF